MRIISKSALQLLLYVLMCLSVFPAFAENNGLNKKYVKESSIAMIVEESGSGPNICLQSVDSDVLVIISNPETGKNTSYKLKLGSRYYNKGKDSFHFNGRTVSEEDVFVNIAIISKKSLRAFLHVNKNDKEVKSVMIDSDCVVFCRSIAEATAGTGKYDTNMRKSISYLTEWLKIHGFRNLFD